MKFSILMFDDSGNCLSDAWSETMPNEAADALQMAQKIDEWVTRILPSDIVVNELNIQPVTSRQQRTEGPDQ